MASNKTLVPEAKQALNQFKMEAANEVGVTLNQGYNGQLTSAQAGTSLKCSSWAAPTIPIWAAPSL